MRLHNMGPTAFKYFEPCYIAYTCSTVEHVKCGTAYLCPESLHQRIKCFGPRSEVHAHKTPAPGRGMRGQCLLGYVVGSTTGNT